MSTEEKLNGKAENEIKSEFRKKLEAKMNELDIKPPEEPKSKKHKAIISVIAFIISAPWIALTFIGALAYGAFSWGFVLYKFWQWFLLPVFPTLLHISISQGVGLMIVVELFDKNLPQILNEDLVNINKKYIYDFIAPIIAFIFGWFVWYFLLPLGF